MVLLAALLGLGIGSFANVVIWRVPRGESVVTPRSACPKCGTPIRARHNIPVISWLWLRGRCADCGAPISLRYPLIELAVGLVFAVIVLASGVRIETLLLLVFAAFSLILAVIDFEVRRLPNAIVGPCVIAIAAVIVLACAVSGDWGAALRALLGALAVGALYGIAWLIYPAGLGFGDVKLAPVIGAFLAFFGWGVLVVGTLAGFVWGACAGIVAMIAARRMRKVAIPFGPWMFVGAWTGVLVGARAWQWYVNDIVGL